ncbi:MAG: FHA domain-containing protein [Acidobacteria bacterium]|nr:FHA domain-containing protein [Acidobacteriota bacterium]
MARRYGLLLLLMSLTGVVSAAVSPDVAALYREQYRSRLYYLRVNIYSQPYEAAITETGVRLPTELGREALFSAGEPVRVEGVDFSESLVTLRLATPNGSRRVSVRITFPEPLDPPFSAAADFTAAVARILTAEAGTGRAAGEEEPPAPEAEPEVSEPEEAEPEKPAREEVRLLVEPGAAELPGDGDAVTTITISARDLDGRLLGHLSGPVAVRINAGRLSAEQAQMVNGMARLNLQVPILDDEAKLMQRSIQLTYVIVRKILGQGSAADAREVALEAARQGPNLAALSTVKGDKPWVYIIAEFQGVKGKAKIHLTPAPTPVSGIAGYYEGEDITGSSTWTFDTSTMILKQKGYRDEIPVEFTGKGAMGFYEVSVGGIGTSLMPLPGDSFYLIAPPILFHRVSQAPTETAPPETIKPKPTVSLTARRNPLAADGESTTDVIFQYKDAQGRPRSGVQLTWKLDRWGALSADKKGRLLRSEKVTRPDGTARALYQAPQMDARDMQETGSIKNRDITVDYVAGQDSGYVNCQIGLLKSAPLRLVVEKPGVERMALPIKLGSLNGTIQGRVLLKMTRFRAPGLAARLPLNDAAVKLEGDEKILKWAAVDEVVTDEDGRFSLTMHMRNWPKWDKEFKQPFLVTPSARFLGLQHNATKYLGEWPAATEVRLKGQDFILFAQSKLARFSAEDAEGLQEKLELFSWMIMVLKDARKDAGVAVGEFLDHAWTLLKAVGSYFYANSRLEKYVNKKYKALETSWGVRKLRELKARFERSQRHSGSVANQIFAWLAQKLFLNAAPSNTPAAGGAGGRFAYGSLNRFLIPQILKNLTDMITGWVNSQVKPSMDSVVAESLLEPYDRLGDQYLLLLLENEDYAQIHRGFTSAYAGLKTRHQYQGIEFQRVTEWRIAETYLTVLIDTISECGQTALKILSVTFMQPELLEMANKLDKIQQTLDNVMAGARFAEECYRFVAILDKSLQAVLSAAAGASGVTVTAGLAPGNGALPAAVPYRTAGFALAAEERPFVAPLELADSYDWDAFRLANRRAVSETMAYLVELPNIHDLWLAEALPGLVDLNMARPDQLARFREARERWDAAGGVCRRLILEMGDAAGTKEPGRRWTTAVDSLREAVEEYQSVIEETCRAVAELPPAGDMVLADQVGRRIHGGGIPPIPVWIWIVAGGLLLMLGLGGVALVLVIRSRRKSRAGRAAGPQTAIAAPNGSAAQPGVRTGPPLPPAPGVRPAPAPAPQRPAATPAFAAKPAAPSAAPSATAGPKLRTSDRRVIVLNAKCTTLGAAPDNAIIIPTPGVQPRHARIWRTDDGRIFIENLGDPRQVLVNGQPRDKAWLTAGAVIDLPGWRARVE